MEEDVSKAIEAIIADSKEDLDHILNDKDRNEYAKIIADVYKTKVDQLKIEQADRHDQIQLEIEQKKIKNDRAMRIVEAVLRFVGTTIEVGVPAILLAVEFEKGLDYEKEGVFTSSTLKNLIRFFKPTKR